MKASTTKTANHLPFSPRGGLAGAADQLRAERILEQVQALIRASLSSLTRPS